MNCIKIFAVIILILLQITDITCYISSFNENSELRKMMKTESKVLIDMLGEEKYLKKYRFWNIVIFIIKAIIIGLIIR